MQQYKHPDSAALGITIPPTLPARSEKFNLFGGERGLWAETVVVVCVILHDFFPLFDHDGLCSRVPVSSTLSVLLSLVLYLCLLGDPIESRLFRSISSLLETR